MNSRDTVMSNKEVMEMEVAIQQKDPMLWFHSAYKNSNSVQHRIPHFKWLAMEAQNVLQKPQPMTIDLNAQYNKMVKIINEATTNFLFYDIDVYLRLVRECIPAA